MINLNNTEGETTTQDEPPGITPPHLRYSCQKPESDQASRSTYQFKGNRRGRVEHNKYIKNTTEIQSSKSRKQTPQDKSYSFLSKSTGRLEKKEGRHSLDKKRFQRN